MKEYPEAMILLEDINTGKKEIAFPIEGKFEFLFTRPVYLQVWYDMEFAGTLFLSEPSNDALDILITDCE